MKKITALILYTCLMAISSRADVIFQDLFTYTNGPIIANGTNVVGGVMVTNWIRFSGSASPSDLLVNNNRLEVSATGSGPNRQDDCGRLFSITNNSVYTNSHQLIYVSYVVNFTNLPSANGAYFGMLKNGVATSTYYQGKIWALTGSTSQTSNNFAVLPNTFRLGVSANSSGAPSKVFPIDLALNTDYQVVLGWDPVTLDAMTLWVNPVSSSDVSATSGGSDTFVPAANNIADDYAFRQASGFGGFLTVSNLAVSTTFLEAWTNVLSTNAVAPKIVYQPVGATNFVGATVTMTAVANGQGLGSLTYQWFKGASLYSNPAGNTNVLVIANAQTTDSGNYTLVAITPYGLSATSSVAKVLISAAPVPPTFVTQPASQNLYSGQNLILTATVSSPGNCTFTWYSNNVAVLTTGPDSSGASTFEMDDVLPVNSATYKVAVTNDVVVTTGIVSTNAVVSVVNPSGVTIAYLRSLVDPNNNYVPTNTTTPFQVTGVITTYTNLTSGNTLSYYLQDATAGINIFATFGSTFRPAQGDMVTFVGVLSSFTSGLELYADTTTRPYTSYTDIGPGTLPTPLSIPFTVTNNNYPNMNYTIGGKLVQLSNVYFGTNSGNIITNGFVTVTNGLGQPFNLWISSVDLDVMGQTWPAYASTVTGVMFGSMNSGSPNFALAVTKFTDINTNLPPTPIPLNLGFAAGTLTFNWTNSDFILQAATNVAGPYTTITNAADGFTTNTSSGPTMFFRLYHP